MLNLPLLSLVGLSLSLLWLDQPCCRLCQKITKKAPPWSLKFLRALASLPSLTLIFFLLPGIWLYMQQDCNSSVIFTLSVLLTLGSALSLKLLFRRPRPQNPTLKIFSLNAGFPSMHVAGSSAAALALLEFIPNYAQILLALTGLVSLSRLLTRAHFLSDLFGGILLASLLQIFFQQTDFWRWLQLLN